MKYRYYNTYLGGLNKEGSTLTRKVKRVHKHKHLKYKGT